MSNMVVGDGEMRKSVFCSIFLLFIHIVNYCLYVSNKKNQFCKMLFLVIICANQRFIPKSNIPLQFFNQLGVNPSLGCFKALAYSKFIELISVTILLGKDGMEYNL